MWVAWIIGALVLAGLGWIGWISVQSLIQGRVIAKAARRGFTDPESDAPGAVYGRVEVPSPIRQHGKGDLLWYRAKTQELRGYGRNRSWRTVSTTEDTAVFRVVAGDHEVRIEDHPTEVHGARSSTDYAYGNAGCLGAFTGGTRSRVLWKWLPVKPYLTVLGRLQRRPHGWGVTRGTKVGLLFSPAEPRRAALTEMWKGIAGLVLVGLSLLAAAWFLVTGRF